MKFTFLDYRNSLLLSFDPNLQWPLSRNTRLQSLFYNYRQHTQLLIHFSRVFEHVISD